MNDTEQLKYPIGKFQYPQSIDDVNIPSHIDIIARLPLKLREATVALDDSQLDTPYRPEVWTVRQVVHHLADSHINAYCRFKLAMSEENPVIKPYLEALWAEFEDGKSAPIFHSLNLLDAVHGRWIIFLKSMKKEDYKRTFLHPEYQKTMFLFQTLNMYSWHCEHHLAHITELAKRKGW